MSPTLRASQLNYRGRYRFTAKALEGSDDMLISQGKRVYVADFVRSAGGDLEFNFNGMKLFVDSGTDFIDEDQAYGGRRRKTRSRSRKQRRKNRRSRKN